MGCPGGDTDSRRGLLVTTEAEMRGMWPRTREPGATEDGEAERTLLWGLWEEPGTPTPDVGLSESFSHPRRELMPSLQASDLGVVGSDTPRNG